MGVYDLKVDFDGTTRSTEHSIGLFGSYRSAVRKLHELKLKDWQTYSIVYKEVTP